MQPFTGELLTILILICISWAGVTCIAVVILIIVFICKSCKKRRRSTFVKPIRTQSTTSTASIENHSPLNIHSTTAKNPVRKVEQHKKFEAQKQRYDTMSVISEQSYSPYHNKNTYEQEDSKREKIDESPRKYESRVKGQRYQQKQHQSYKPVADVRVIDRHTPYPPDVIARAKLMNNSRFPADDRF